jgi:monoamine oxidase
VAIGGKPATAAEIAHRALNRDLKPDDSGLDPGTLLDRYIGVLPRDLADPEAGADSYARWTSYDRVTWPEFLRSRGATPEAIKLMTVGGDASDLSALYVLRQFAMLRGATERYKIQGGMDLLPRAMASALGDIVRYNAPVVRVTRESAGRPGPTAQRALRFRVEYRSTARVESLTAGRIIFAIPFTTLRDIEIRPPLSKPKTQAIAHLSYYSGTRFLLQSRSRFWRAADLSGSARTDRATEVWDSTFDQVTSARGILGASVGGSVGRPIQDMTPEDSLRFGIGLVADAFPGIRAQFEKGVVQRWAVEPWSRGAFPVFKPGEMSTLMPTIARAENGIHFAGEHTSSWTGWMEGALRSGERAAREVLNS